MSEFIKNSIKKNKPHFLKYKKYIDDNDWRNLESLELPEGFKGRIKSTVDLRKEEFSIQNDLVKAIIERLKVFVKKSEGDHHIKVFKDFIKDTLKIVNSHTLRADEYTSDSDIAGIKDGDLRAEEVSFHNDLFKAVSSIDDAVLSLNIKDDILENKGIIFLDKQKATLSMHEHLVTQYPDIKYKLDSMGIDFVSPPPKELHILNSNPPIWNKEKNYWEQDKETLQYYVNEYKKIDYGLEIDGYYFDGWLYFHFNHFFTNIPTVVEKGGIKENKDITKVPDLRDNELIITEYFNKSKRESTMSLVAATRRVAKTTMNASRIVRAQILGKKQILCAGGASEDLGHISNNITVCNDNMNSAFKLYYLAPTDDGRGKSYGIKTKDNKSKTTTNVYIINLEGGTNKKKKETLAGFTPDEFILDEAMKFPFMKQLEALESALWGTGILRCNVLITGTGGDDELASDAISMLNDPKANRVTLMDWDTLDKNVPKDLITWQRKDFGLFLPTQMCIKHVKIKSNLADFLGIKSEYLKKVVVYVTDWETSKKAEDEERKEKSRNKAKYVRLLAYHPFDPTEIFLSGKISPFPIEEAKAHKQYLLESGLWDRRRTLFRDSNGKIQVELSNKDLAPFPHKGGNIEAPYLIFEDPPTERVKYGTYTAGFDDYKHDDSESSSVATFYIWKNEIIGDKFSDKLVASMSFKPERHPKVHETWLLLMEAYQLERTCFGENEDFDIKTYLDRKGLTEKYLAVGLDFTKNFTLSNNLKRTYGWTPQSSKRLLFKLFVDYCDQEFKVEDDKGNEITLKGVQRIDDIGLLDEIINWSENTNVDRITAAMGAVGYGHYLRTSYTWKIAEKRRETEEKKKPIERQRTFYSTTQRQRTFFTNR